jgi:hypothetical protein
LHIPKRDTAADDKIEKYRAANHENEFRPERAQSE